MEKPTTVELKHITTGYRKTVVTRDIDARLHAGEFTCLLGPNGAGKSTLLKTLCAFQPPLSGEIYINGTDLKEIGPKQLARRLGVVLTERPVTINMTVRELVAIGRSPYTSFFGGTGRKDMDIVEESIRLAGVSALADRKVSTLSDGERQKAFIAKTLAQQTEIIFLDEPTAFLDYPSKVETMKLLYRLAEEGGKTIFMSTHDVELARQIADRIWLLDKRHGLTIGTPDELARNGKMAEYLETADLKFNPETQLFEIVI